MAFGVIMRFALLMFLIVLMGVSCGVESLEPDYSLNPPLGLTAESVSNGIKLSFWGLNEEDYFNGYVVYIGRKREDVIEKKYKVKNDSNDLPTIIMGAFSVASNITYVVTRDQDGNALLSGEVYYFAVAAYSKTKDVYSPISNITNAVR